MNIFLNRALFILFVFTQVQWGYAQSYLQLRKPVFSLGFGYDDNVFRLPDTDGDYFYEGKASLGIFSKESPLSWSLNGRLTDRRFLKYDNESTFDSVVSMDVSREFLKKWTLELKTGYEYDHVDREDPSSHRANSLARITRLTGDISLTQESALWLNTFEYGIKDLNYRDTSVENSSINTDDEDRIEQEVRFRSKYTWREELQPKFHLVLANGSYDASLDDNGFGRNSKELVASFGFDFKFLSLLRGTVLSGPAFTRFDDSQFHNLTSFDWEAMLVWQEKDSAYLARFLTQSDFKETNVATASGYTEFIYQLAQQYSLDTDTNLALEITYVDINFRGFDLEMDDLSITPSVQYKISDSLTGKLEYSWKKRSSNLESTEYEANVVLGSIQYAER